ncbi:MAG: V-type ATP synthase subunit B [Candidatus Micrarchaeota archaeon]|nr:V-type ATP synthase subunit B [Candidatus Micrarchaeota archaeon]MDE1834461.1 V-type ATP synthase subunit B [Candidatus Micrarchaeota archaeon]MDE1859314.1 V-type ATP synthase subunit B [Candidatus Micrarchaeota archaeon]
MKFEIEYSTIENVAGPLVVVGKVRNAQYNEIVKIKLQDGEERLGQVLDTSSTQAIVQVFGPTNGININNTSVSFLGETLSTGVSEGMLGRVFDGQGRPRDTSAGVSYDDKRDINGYPINPVARAYPSEFIETGISAIDGLDTLVRGQKLPIFSSSGLPHNQLAAQVTRQASVKGTNESFAVVFAGIGMTYDDYRYFFDEFKKTGALKNTAAFINLADDPSIERIITPRLALTTAEYLAFDRGMHVLVIMTDMTNYAESLRELSSAREEVPGRRGYPGYMYTDLASLYERAGIIRGKPGSITQLDIVTMPSDDVTHPIPDLTGYITEGQIFMSRELSNRGLYPAIQPLGSLSRLMNNGIGAGKTREDHKGVSDQLYGLYAKAQEARSLSAIVGAEALSESDKRYLKFGEDFENNFLKQGFYERRTIEDTLNIGWDLLSQVPEGELTRVKKEYIEKYYKKNKVAK